MSDEDRGAPESGEARQRYPSPPDDIGAVAGRDHVPQIALAERPPEVVDPPPPTKETPEQLRGMVYVPPGLPEGARVAGQCQYCGSWYVWPVVSADGVSLLQCASCYTIYRPLGD